MRAEHYDGGFLAPNGVAVLTYFASTQLYRHPMHDESIPLDTRARIAPTYAALAQQAVDASGGNLDSTSGTEIINLLLALRDQHHTTILLATHDTNLAHRADHTIHLKDGQIVPS